MIDELKRRTSGWIATVARGDVQLTLQPDPAIPNDEERVIALIDRYVLNEAKPIVQAPVNVMASAPIAVAPANSLVQSMAHWMTLNQANWARKTGVEFARIAEEFCIWMAGRGKSSTNAVVQADIAEYKVYLLSARPKKILSQKTVNKHIATLNSLFATAQLAGHYQHVVLPTKGQLFKKKSVAKTSRPWLPLTPADIQLLFEPVHYLRFARKPDQFWVMLIMLGMGTRVGEASQLSTTDFTMVGDLAAVAITDETIDDASIKTDSSRRVVPLHPMLVQLGLLDYVEDVRRLVGDGLIFPYLRQGSINGYGDAPGGAINTYMQARLQHDRKRGHSFRHTVVESMKQAGIDEEWRCEFVGHAHDTINSKVYASALNVAKLHSIVFSALDFNLNIAALKYEASMFDAIILREVRRQTRNITRSKARANRNLETAASSGM